MDIKYEKDIPLCGINFPNADYDTTSSAKLRYIHKFGGAVPGHQVPPQSHACHEIVYYGNDCAGTVTIDGITHSFVGGDIAIISQNIVHEETHTGKGTLFFFGFKVNDPALLPPDGVYHNMWDIKPIINSMLQESVNQQPHFEHMLRLDLQKFLIILSRRTQTRLNTKSITSLKYVKNYIDENYAQNIVLTSLANSVGYSLGHFRRMFLSAYQVSPQSYLINLRCEKAVELLETSSLTCTEVAYHCGFSDSAQLSRLMKKKYGMSPLQIRKAAKEKNGSPAE